MLTVSNSLFKGRGEAGTDGDGKSIQLRGSSLFESEINDLGEPLLVETFGQIGDGPAPIGVITTLRGNDITKDAPATGDGGTSVVETGFDREDGRFFSHVEVF
ncbi:MAG: hypothetical protein UX82_C0007G0019 [Microgenomates group bacterium GW2011_GWE1_47_12]|nr:MAG: hypothetical protein UX32_C0006G0026 [Microgenomates group bacterium GW2011_GWF1_46_12]KKU43514.1 MAG: hypothetical protein UX59_C0015G0005 [Microgenomates group bacterium GW2011_GWA1_46_7]KKU45051.1 MAG: hypothetical protein UX63_C0013G0001 [Microgenomates group bacterium GW2011_GWB1_46_7]KKU60822.1 MAG: hypothetical protein UX82_C0007G0019 [Microgenomates group bacterium GW2011_GWE1_47_12]KKU62767.1 MAG: hypothetical protein UX84_C0002G0028 [Microgenomates group bacterium GW2011_GWD1_